MSIRREEADRAGSRRLLPRQLLVDDRLQGLPVLHAAQHPIADDEERHAGHPDLLVGVPQRPAMGLPIRPGPQGLLELASGPARLRPPASSARRCRRCPGPRRRTPPAPGGCSRCPCRAPWRTGSPRRPCGCAAAARPAAGRSARPSGGPAGRPTATRPAGGTRPRGAGWGWARAEARTASIRPRHPGPGRLRPAETPPGSRTVRRNRSRPGSSGAWRFLLVGSSSGTGIGERRAGPARVPIHTSSPPGRVHRLQVASTSTPRQTPTA